MASIGLIVSVRENGREPSLLPDLKDWPEALKPRASRAELRGGSNPQDMVLTLLLLPTSQAPLLTDPPIPLECEPH